MKISQQERLNKWLREIVQSNIEIAKTNKDKEKLSGSIGIQIAKIRMSKALQCSLYQLEKKLRKGDKLEAKP